MSAPDHDDRPEPPSSERLLAEQVGYYRAIAPEYEQHAIPGARGGELAAAVESFRPTGTVLELACGTGAWTEQLLRHADSITAVDASAEMLAIAASHVHETRVRFIHADLFSWTPDQRYDNVFFGFWLSHVPIERFETFWTLLASCLEPAGRVMFVDDAHRTHDELIYGESSTVVRRRLRNGAAYNVVKVPHTPRQLEERIRRLGWRVSVTQTSEPFFYGIATPA